MASFMKKRKLEKGFTLVELLVSLLIVSIVGTVATVSSIVYLDKQNEAIMNEKVNTVLDAYHRWYSDANDYIRANTAENCIYKFVNDDTLGVSSFGYNKFLFNYSFKNKQNINNCLLIFEDKEQNMTSVISIPVDTSNAFSVEEGFLLIGENAKVNNYESYSLALLDNNLVYNDLCLGDIVQNGEHKQARKVTRVVVEHTNNNEQDFKYFTNNQSFKADSYPIVNFTDVNGQSDYVCLSKNDKEISKPNNEVFNISGTAINYEENVKINDSDVYESVIVYGENIDYVYNDGKLPSLNNTAAYIRFGRSEKKTKEHYSHEEICLRKNQHLLWSPWRDWSPSDYNKLEHENTETIKETELVYESYYLNDINDVYKYSEQYVDGNHTIYDSTYKVLDFTSKYYYSDTWYSAGLESTSFKRYRDLCQDKYYTEVTYDPSTFEIYIGDATLEKDFKVPNGFKLIMNYDYSVSNLKDQSDVIKNYNDSKGMHDNFVLTNKLKINRGVTLDLNGSSLKVNGLFKPVSASTSINNVGAFSMIENNGVINAKNSKLEVYGFIKGSGEIKTNENTSIYERTSLLDYTNYTNVACNLISNQYGMGSRSVTQPFSSFADYFSKTLKAATKKDYSQPLSSKMNVQSIQCDVLITKGTKYSYRIFGDFNNNKRIIDYYVFGKGGSIVPEKSGWPYDRDSNGLFQIEEGSVIRRFDGKNISYETNDAVVNSTEVSYLFLYDTNWLYNSEIIVSSTFSKVSLYNTDLIFKGHSSLNLATYMDIQLMPGSSLQMRDNSSLNLGDESNISAVPSSIYNYYKELNSSRNEYSKLLFENYDESYIYFDDQASITLGKNSSITGNVRGKYNGKGSYDLTLSFVNSKADKLYKSNFTIK